MIDPLGRFFDNVHGYLSYSRPILSVGLASTFEDVTFSLNKLNDRKGVYEWE